MKRTSATLPPPAAAPETDTPSFANYLRHYRVALADALAATTATSACGNRVGVEHALETLVGWSATLRRKGGTQYFAGNGASAAMASHMALDWSKNGGVRSLAFNDPMFLTALANDLGVEQLFAEPLRRFAHLGDLFIAVSSSGNSPNILRALEVAREKGLLVVTFTGMKPGNAARQTGDLNFHVPALTYGIVECAHQVILHAWLDRHLGLREWAADAD